MNRNYLKYFIIVILFFVFLFLFLNRDSNFDQISLNQKQENLKTSFIKIKDTILNVEIADTLEKRTLGLGKRKNLLENNGMLFIFEQKGPHFFWMKDMNFPIDIIWFDENQKVIFIEQKIDPSSYPNLFGTELESKYVLETVSGFVEKNQIKVGDSFVFIEN